MDVVRNGVAALGVGLVAACGVLSACTAVGDASAARMASSALAHDVELAPDIRLSIARVGAGATLASLLRAHQVVETEIAPVIERVAAVFDPRKVRADRPYRLAQGSDGTLRRFEYEIDGDRVLRLERSPRGDISFEAAIAPIAKTRTVTIVRGRIDRTTSSLFAAMEAAGETVDLPLALADIFGGEIDFNTELQPGDGFELAVEKLYRACDDEALAPCEGPVPAGYGPILAARFDNDGRRLQAVRFTPENGQAGYFDEQGRSLKRFFLRSPLKFEPSISSGFSRARLHPILQRVRAHLGVDYRAPAGAPVIAVADGVVLSAGPAGDAGRMVHLRHANGFETEYLHLSSIAVRAGARLGQGDLVGRVGATGLATGPHLDYRMKKNGVFVNPLTVHREMPPAEPVAASQMATFLGARDRALATLQGLSVPPGPPAAPAVAAHQ